MFKKLLAAFLCLTLLLLSGCSLVKKSKKSDKNKGDEKTSVVEEEPKGINNLTGLEMDVNKQNLRPVAIMINNISVAQPVQTGINKADIIYETEVEGGITRLMAVFKDIASVGQIGTIRSARYPYVDLALAHDAVYFHCGQDNTYCKPHLRDIDDISIDTGTCGGTRISNGLAREHTLYSFGNKLLEGIKGKKIDTTLSSNPSWQNFGKEDENIAFTDVCNKVSVSFSTSYKTVFQYDSTKGKYTRYFGTTLRKDYVTGETVDVKNVFVLMTSVSNYPDGYHRRVELTSGDGYYMVNGTYQKIKWSKGSSTSPLKFTDEAGNTLKVNAGNSWVCLADSRTSQPVIE
ncbi:MAG: DUF3048 domain-containing protein [Clostridia bacterium]|nr:DUF3048 domain-containing protein [Clostridia bacterium]